AVGCLSSFWRVRHDRSCRPQWLDRSRAGDHGVADVDSAGRGEHYSDLLREGSGKATGVTEPRNRAWVISNKLAVPSDFRETCLFTTMRQKTDSSRLKAFGMTMFV